MITDIAALPRPFFALAPMDDVTDTVFRQVVADCAAPDIFFTEFANVDGLQSPGRVKLVTKLIHTNKDQPLIAQLWGLKPENFFTTAKEISGGKLGSFAGIDLNMGCPAKSEVQNGACSALINNRELAREIIQATKEGAGGKIPVSVKTRIGFNNIDMTWPEFLLKQGIDMLTIHGRTRQEMSKVPAHWDVIQAIRQLRDDLSAKTLIVGNGDVLTRAQGEALAKKYGLDGIMIGRGIFHDPFVFGRASPWADYTKGQRIALYLKQVQLFKQTWKNGERNVKTLNKFCKIYINDFAGAKELRERLMAAGSTDKLMAILQ